MNGGGEAVAALRSKLDAYRGRSILITGGRGYLGSALTVALGGIDCKLVVLDRSSSDAWRPEGPRAQLSVVTADASGREIWDEVLPGVDLVFHLAGAEYARDGDGDPLLDLQCNALPVVRLLEACRARRHFPRIVFTSSANLFGAGTTLPMNEDGRDDPLIPWSAHKLLAESYLRIYAQRYAIRSLSLRLANVYGPAARPAANARVAVNRMIADALAGEPLSLYENRDCVRDYVFIEDVTRALLLAGSRSEPFDRDCFVIGSGKGTSIAQMSRRIAERIRLRTGRDVPIRHDASAKLDRFEMRNFVADTTRFRNATGWTPRISLSEGIDLTLDSAMAATRNSMSTVRS